MRAFLLVVATVFITAIGYSQATPLTITNASNCNFLVYPRAAVGCGVMPNCGSTICILPGATISVPPCGPAAWIWEGVRVIPVDAACIPACPPATVVTVSQTGCAPIIASNIHCACGGVPYTADFSMAPDLLMIF